MICCCSVAQSCPTFSDPMDYSTQTFPLLHCLSDFTQSLSIKFVMLSSYLLLCCPLLLPPSILPSIRVFTSESVLRIRWPKDWSFSFRISPSNEYPGLSSFRIDLFDLLTTQGTLKSLLQHHNSKVSILWCSLWSNFHIHT